MLLGISMADSVGIYPRLLLCCMFSPIMYRRGLIHAVCYLVLQWFTGGVRSPPVQYCMIFRWFSGSVWPTTPTVCFPMMYRRCFMYAFCYMVCNGLQECSTHTFCYMVLQWFTRVVQSTPAAIENCNNLHECWIHAFCYMVLQSFPRCVWSTPSALWFCNGLQEMFDPRLLLFGYAIVLRRFILNTFF